MNIREIKLQDGEKLTKLFKKVDEDSDYMLWEAGERDIQIETQVKMIEEFIKANNSTILVVENGDELVGYLLAKGGVAKRNKHTVYIVIGILNGYRGKGIGTNLFKELEKWALSNDIKRLELTVVVKNEAGLSLYKKAGFEVEGVKRNSLFIDGEFVDEYYMSKLFSA